MEATCEALLAAYLSGMNLGPLDKSTIYSIPASALSQLSSVQLATARACASQLGIRYRIVRSPSSFPTPE
jgi:hypothetical protein